MARRGVLYSSGTKYAIRAAIYLANHPEGAPARHIAGECGLTPCFLSAVLQTLARAGIVASTKGARGGFILSRPPARIHISDLVRAVDSEGWLQPCALGAIRCSPARPCALHHEWAGIRSSIESWLRRTTIAELARADGKLLVMRAHASAE